MAGRRSWSKRLVGLGAAASVVALVLLGSPAGSRAPGGGPVVLPGGSGSGVSSALSGADPGRLGELDDPVRRAGCLGRLGVAASSVLDARRVDWHGTPAVRFVLASSRVGVLRVLLVAPECGPRTAVVLADVTYRP
jgi:hypothetical protein